MRAEDSHREFRGHRDCSLLTHQRAFCIMHGGLVPSGIKVLTPSMISGRGGAGILRISMINVIRIVEFGSIEYLMSDE